MDRYADFGTSLWVRVKNHPIWQLGDCCCPRVHSCSCSCWFRPSGVVQDGCGNVGCCSMASYTGGPCSPLVTHARPVRRSLKQPIIDGRSLATPVLPGNLYGRCFTGSRLWNRSVFMVFVQSYNLFAGRSSLRKLILVRDPAIRWRSECRW